MPGTTPSQPGWYPDGDGGERWYDGNGWTDHVRGAAANAPADEPPANDATVVVPVTPPTGELPQAGAAVPPPAWDPLGGPAQLQVGRGLRIALAVGGVLLLIAVAVVGGIVLLGGDDKKADSGTDDTSTSTTPTTPSGSESSLDVPTIDPSDFPTATPPSKTPDLPPLPSDFPTKFPTEFPTSFPTDPSAWNTWFSDYLEQVKP